MKQLLSVFLCLVVLLFWSSCRNDFEFSPSTGNLEFAKDTVYLDTVFTNIGTSTYNLKVYNRSDDDIVIPTIQLENGENSFYRLNVDGSTGIQNETQIGKFFENVEVLANDSLYIFIETTIDISETNSAALENQFLYTDKILFDTGSNQQDVDLVTLVKDAVFIYPNRDETTGVIETLSFDTNGDGTIDDTALQGRFLEDTELNFTNQKPYVIYGYAAVGSGKTLTIDAGARIHFHADSGLIITENATLNVNGTFSPDQDTLDNEVIFEGDRLEPLYEDVPGQWGTIWLYNGSTNNTINYATIKNATIGILAEGNPLPNDPSYKLNLTNTQIYNSSAFGVLGRATSILAENIVINNSGQSSFAGTYGGKYNVTHSTIANYWDSSFRQFPSLLINDFIVDENNTVFTNALTQANFNNCIIYGNDSTEFILEAAGDAFNYKFDNCLLKFSNSTLEGTTNYDFNDTNFYEGSVFNNAPDFEAPFDNLMRIGTNAPENIANPTFANLVQNDILQVSRLTAPDVGAYQRVSFED